MTYKTILQPSFPIQSINMHVDVDIHPGRYKRISVKLNTTNVRGTKVYIKYLIPWCVEYVTSLE